MVNTFSANQNQHYRAQLHAIQVDMTLVIGADPYTAEAPLDDSGEEIRELVERLLAPDAQGNGGIPLPNEDAARTDFWALAGKRYGEFVREVNDAIEQRDAELTSLHVWCFS